MKKWISLLLMVLCLAGCGVVEESDNTLWVISEVSTSDGMNYQAEIAASTIRELYPEVEVTLELLPTEKSERERYLKQLRTKILAGEGPDVYLLPTSADLIVDADKKNHTDTLTVEPLFADVTQAMYTGIFADAAKLYDADHALNTAGLRREVMTAGVVDGARYVFPLRFDMPIVLTEDSQYGDQSLNTLARLAVDTGDGLLAAGLELPRDTSAFPKLFDYEAGELLVTMEEIQEYLTLYQNWYALAAPVENSILGPIEEGLREKYNSFFHDFFPDVLQELGISVTRAYWGSVNQYIAMGDIHWTAQGFPVYTTTLNSLLDNAILEQAMEREFQETPILRSDGTVGAEVTYWGAIGAGCQNMEVAWDYLRLFLTEDYQWDGVRPRTDRSHDNAYGGASEIQNMGLVENSWPVRDNGAIAHLFKTFQYRNYHLGRTAKDEGIRRAAVKAIDFLPDGCDSVLECTIDEVRFPIYLPEDETLAAALSLLNNADGTPTDVDTAKLAEDVYQNLWWHLAEG